MLRYGIFLVALGLAAASHGVEEHCCSAEDRHEVQQIWKSVWSAEFTGRRVAIGQSVFNDLFEHHPETKELFKRVNVDDVNSPEFKAHCIRVINGLDMSINLLDDPASLDEALEHLSHQHAERKGVKADFFDAFGESFLRVMPQVSHCFNPTAWNRCFHRITDAISHGLP